MAEERSCENCKKSSNVGGDVCEPGHVGVYCIEEHAIIGDAKNHICTGWHPREK